MTIQTNSYLPNTEGKLNHYKTFQLLLKKQLNSFVKSKLEYCFTMPLMIVLLFAEYGRI